MYCMSRLKVHSEAIELALRLAGLLQVLAQGADMAKTNLVDLSMHLLIELVLPFRSSKYTQDLCEKMGAEGIAKPADLLKASKEALETKLCTHASFNFMEMADAISLRCAIDPAHKTSSSSSDLPRQQLRSPLRRGRSRTPRRGRSRSFDNRSGGCHRGGFPIGSRSHRRGRDQYRGPGRNEKENKEKPALWAACERNDAAAVAQLLSEGKDIEETFEGCTPLMKAAERNAIDCLQLLLEKKTDTEACNQKGRTAPSLAAASSAELVSLKIQLSNLIKSTSYCAVRIMLEKGEADRRKAWLAHIINEAMKLLSKMPSKGKNESA